MSCITFYFVLLNKNDSTTCLFSLSVKHNINEILAVLIDEKELLKPNMDSIDFVIVFFFRKFLLVECLVPFLENLIKL